LISSLAIVRMFGARKQARFEFKSIRGIQIFP
jgi:hypothetical protein